MRLKKGEGGGLGAILLVGLLGLLLVLEGVQGQAGSATILSGHNAARATAQLSPKPQVALSALTWNASTAQHAQAYVNKCIYAHGGNAGEGQNLYVSANLTMDVDTAFQRAVSLWVGEKAWYTYSTVPNGCNGTTCGHYTQVIWANTKMVGCAYKVCNGNLTGWSASTSGLLVNCHYYPPGNYQTQYPYLAASPSPTRTRTRTRTKSKSKTRSRTRSGSRTRTRSRTRTKTSPSRTKSKSRTRSRTKSRSRTRTRTRSRSFTRSVTPTRTWTPTMSLTPTISITPSWSITPSFTSSSTPSVTPSIIISPELE